MKRILMICGVVLVTLTTPGMAQKMDDERMNRDIEVARNVLSTLIKQQFDNQRTFFPLEIRGTYQSGYGVTFTLPADFTTPIVLAIPPSQNNSVVVTDGSGLGPGITYEYRIESDEEDGDPNVASLRDRARDRRRSQLDSTREVYNKKVIEAAKTFLLDYGDMISQLAPNERVVITNQGNQPRMWVNQFFNNTKRTHLAVETTKADITAYRQGKLSRDQALSRIKVVNTETVTEVEPDLELLVSMFNRLYRPDLSKTYFTENNIYYERLKDFGAIFYMSVYSAVETSRGRFRMPTTGDEGLDLETRNKKVKELYPVFEKELKENILEYGRTVKSLNNDEVLVFQVQMTKCPSCNIPSTLEYSVSGSVLKDYSSGKIEKNSATSKISVKKGAMQ
jgi:hypothetical protein